MWLSLSRGPRLPLALSYGSGFPADQRVGNAFSDLAVGFLRQRRAARQRVRGLEGERADIKGRHHVSKEARRLRVGRGRPAEVVRGVIGAEPVARISFS